MAGISLNYNGVELSQWFDVTDVQRNIGTSHVNSMTKIGQSDGQLWQYMSRDTKTITISGIVTNTNLANLRRDLGAALDVDEPEQLIIGDDTGVYYLAIYDGQPTIAEDWRSGTISLSFIVPDGIAHSVATQTADNMPYKNLSDNLLHNTGDDWNPNIWSQDGTATTQDGITTATNTSKSVISTVVEPNDSSWLTSGATVTTSVDVKGQGSILFGYYTGSSWEGDSRAQQVNSDEYIRIYFTRVINSTHFDTGHPNFAIDAICPTSTLTIRHVKVEQGTSASPWSPNPADPEYYSDTINFTNKGSYKSYPLIELTMGGDNGYIGLASSSGGYLEFGNAEEVDGVTMQKTEHALALGLESAPSGVQYNVGATNYPNYVGDSGKPNVRQGSITYGKDPVGGTAAIPTFINGSYWAGPSLYVPISVNSAGSAAENFSYTARGIYNTSKNAMGRLEQVLQSGSDVAFESVLRDSTNNADQIVWEVWIQNTLVKSQSLNRKNFANNKYIQTQITKIGPNIKFALGAVSKISAGNVATVKAPLIVSSTRYDLASLSIDGWSSWFERWQGNQHVLMSLSDVRFDWINVDYWVDEPNRWASGDVVTIDTRNKQVLTNGVVDVNLNTIGNHWDDFYLAPGDNNIQIGYSSWANAPQVEINWEEAFV